MSERETGEGCGRCGRSVGNRGFRLGERALCEGCASKVGGAYDEVTDEWCPPPDLAAIGEGVRKAS